MTNSVSSVLRKDELNDLHSVTHPLFITSNMEDNPSVRTQNRRLGGSNNRSEHDGGEENRIQPQPFSPWLLILFITQHWLKFFCNCVFNIPRDCVHVCVLNRFTLFRTQHGPYLSSDFISVSYRSVSQTSIYFWSFGGFIYFSLVTFYFQVSF
jgi:hypothetical protein